MDKYIILNTENIKDSIPEYIGKTCTIKEEKSYYITGIGYSYFLMVKILENGRIVAVKEEDIKRI